MSREKQIEEMARVLCGMASSCNKCMFKKTNCYEHKEAEAIYNAGYRRQEWISVEERLPEKYQDVLVYRDGYVTTDFVCSVGRFILADVTHWMPLPEPPKGDAE